MSIQHSTSSAFAASDGFSHQVSPEHAAQAESPVLISPRIARMELLLPRSIGGVFDLAFDLYRAHFRMFFTLAAVLLIPLQTILYLLFNVWLKPLNAYLDTHPDDIPGGFGLITGGLLTGYPQAGVPGLLSLLLLAVASAPVAVALAAIYQGETPAWADCYRRAFRHIPRVLLGWTAMVCVCIAVLTITLITASILALLVVWALHNAVPPAGNFILGLVFILMPYIAGMTTLAFGFLFTTPLIVLEDVPIATIPARNWQLVNGSRARRTFAAIVFLPIVFFTLQTLILLSLSGLLKLVSLPPTMAFLLETTLSVLLIAFLQPYLLIFVHVLYFDYRIQRDGLDVSLLAEGLEFMQQPNVFVAPPDLSSVTAPHALPFNFIPATPAPATPIAAAPLQFPMDFSSPLTTQTATPSENQAENQHAEDTE